MCFKAEISPENECDFSAQDDTKKMCGDLCKLEGKMQSSDFLDFVMSEVVSWYINILLILSLSSSSIIAFISQRA